MKSTKKILFALLLIGISIFLIFLIMTSTSHDDPIANSLIPDPMENGDALIFVPEGETLEEGVAESTKN